MVKVSVGDQVVYRVNKGRGRPAVGEVVRNRGILLDIRNLRSDTIVPISAKMVTRSYAFKPYNTKRRQAELNVG